MKSWCQNRTKRQALKSQCGGHVRSTSESGHHAEDHAAPVYNGDRTSGIESVDGAR
jgi:hypothetical protein